MTTSTEYRLDILEVLARADNAATRRDVAGDVALVAEVGVLAGEDPTARPGTHRPCSVKR